MSNNKKQKRINDDNVEDETKVNDMSFSERNHEREKAYQLFAQQRIKEIENIDQVFIKKQAASKQIEEINNINELLLRPVRFFIDRVELTKAYIKFIPESKEMFDVLLREWYDDKDNDAIKEKIDKYLMCLFEITDTKSNLKGPLTARLFQIIIDRRSYFTQIIKACNDRISKSAPVTNKNANLNNLFDSLI